MRVVVQEHDAIRCHRTGRYLGQWLYLICLSPGQRLRLLYRPSMQGSCNLFRFLSNILSFSDFYISSFEKNTRVNPRRLQLNLELPV